MCVKNVKTRAQKMYTQYYYAVVVIVAVVANLK